MEMERMRWNEISGWDTLGTMYKRLLAFGIIGLLFVLGLTYLFIYPLGQTVNRERERQDKVYWSAFNAIEHFGAQSDKDSEQKAKAALDEARAKRLSKTRLLILQSYFQDLKQCYQGDRAACKKVSSDMNDAIRAPR
jgi:hypothetical protein